MGGTDLCPPQSRTSPHATSTRLDVVLPSAAVTVVEFWAATAGIDTDHTPHVFDGWDVQRGPVGGVDTAVANVEPPTFTVTVTGPAAPAPQSRVPAPRCRIMPDEKSGVEKCSLSGVEKSAAELPRAITNRVTMIIRRAIVDAGAVYRFHVQLYYKGVLGC